MSVNKVVFGTETLIDITDSTITPETVALGETAYSASGEKIVGTMPQLEIVQETGDSTDSVMSQKAVTDALATKFPKVDGDPKGYMLVGVKSNGDPVLYTPNNYSAESMSIAQRGSGGVLIVATPTASNHATTKAYVDGKTINYSISVMDMNWQNYGQIGPDSTNDIGWCIPVGEAGITTGVPKAFGWMFTNEGYSPSMDDPSGFNSGLNYASAGLGKVQITLDGYLFIVHATNPSQNNGIGRYLSLTLFY